MSRTDVRPWNDADLAADPSTDLPEITTNEEWRMLMVAARNDPKRKWKQSELAVRVARRSKLTCTQALISQIESGKIASSKLVRPISVELGIPEPIHFQDELMKQLWLSGHLLRTKSMTLFVQYLQMMKSTLAAHNKSAEEEEEEETAPDETPPPRPSRK